MKLRYISVLIFAFLFSYSALAQDISIKYLSPKAEFSNHIVSLMDDLKTDLLRVKSKITVIEVKMLTGETSPELVRIKRSWFGFGDTITFSFFENAKNVARNSQEFSFDLDLKVLLNRWVLDRSQLSQIIEHKFHIEVEPHKNKDYLAFNWDQLAIIYEYLLYYNSLKYKGVSLLSASSLKQIKRCREEIIFDYNLPSAGAYSASQSLIKVAREAMSVKIFAHEFGHAIWDNILGSSERQSYLAISWKNNVAVNTEFISAYAHSSQREDFPEHFAAFFTEPDRLKIISKAKFEFVKFMLGNIEVQYNAFDRLAITLNNGIYYEKAPKIAAFRHELTLPPQYVFELTIPEHGDVHNYINDISLMIPYKDSTFGKMYRYELLNPVSNIVYLPDYRTKPLQILGKDEYVNGHTGKLSWKNSRLKIGLDLHPLYIIKGPYQFESLGLRDRFDNQVDYPNTLVKAFLMKESSNDILDLSTFGFGSLGQPKFLNYPEDLYKVPPKILKSSDIKVTRLTPPNRFYLDVPFELNTNDITAIHLGAVDACNKDIEHSLDLKVIDMCDRHTTLEAILPVQTECQKLIANDMSVHYKGAKGEFQLIHQLYVISIQTIENKPVVLEMPPLEESIKKGFFRNLEDPVIDFGQMEFQLLPDQKSNDLCHCVMSPVISIPIKEDDLDKKVDNFDFYISGPAGRMISLDAPNIVKSKIVRRYQSKIDGEDYVVLEITGKSISMMSGKYAVAHMDWKRKGTNEIHRMRFSQMMFVKDIQIKAGKSGQKNFKD